MDFLVIGLENVSHIPPFSSNCYVTMYSVSAGYCICHYLFFGTVIHLNQARAPVPFKQGGSRGPPSGKFSKNEAKSCILSEKRGVPGTQEPIRGTRLLKKYITVPFSIVRLPLVSTFWHRALCALFWGILHAGQQRDFAGSWLVQQELTWMSCAIMKSSYRDIQQYYDYCITALGITLLGFRLVEHSQ